MDHAKRAVVRILHKIVLYNSALEDGLGDEASLILSNKIIICQSSSESSHSLEKI